MLFVLSAIELAPERTGGEQVHEHADADDEDEIVDDVALDDLHLLEELRRLHVVAVGQIVGLLLAVEVRPVVAVDRDEEAVEAGPEVGDVEEPAEAAGGVHVADAEAEDREENGDYRAGEHGDLSEQTFWVGWNSYTVLDDDRDHFDYGWF